jgi:hypothetical protein
MKKVQSHDVRPILVSVLSRLSHISPSLTMEAAHA